MENLNKVKKDKKNTFKYGTLILCLFFYFMNELPGKKSMCWTSDKPISIQIREHLNNIGDSNARRIALWGYFKNF